MHTLALLDTLDLSLLRYACMGLVIAAGAFLQGVGGLGFAMFSAPVAGLFFPELAPGPLLVLGGSLSGLSALRERQSIDWQAVRSALAGRVAGTLAAAGVMAVFSQRLLAVTFALMILAGVGLSVAGRSLRPSQRNIAAAGVASGLMGTITSAGAPPFALVMHGMPPAQMRSSLGCIFGVGAAVSLALLAAVGDFTVAKLVLGLSLSPFMVGGFLLSSRLTHRVDPRRTRNILLSLAALGALGILARSLLP
ncbi:sulfite exporter TauE/SafE family protein [Xylophilus sp. ASV27]|uniref:sulfite exporter TauE/SafE family protein n=1 Tax=Xylophilus sp. ASV27 TaxID=2795129 RepID=UPI001E304FC8|nr:sulfite exporter TauE/SafE family protein [Xylophilus sp. ASV27]